MEKEEYIRVYKMLVEADPGTKEYNTLLDQLNQINHIAKGEREAFPPPPPTGVAALLGNQALVSTIRDLAVTGAVLYHERTSIVTTKLFSFVRPNKS